MNRRQLLAIGGLGIVAPKAMAAPAEPLEEVRIPVLEPGAYDGQIIGADVNDDKVVMKIQIFLPVHYVIVRFAVNGAEN